MLFTSSISFLEQGLEILSGLSLRAAAVIDATHTCDI